MNNRQNSVGILILLIMLCAFIANVNTMYNPNRTTIKVPCITSDSIHINVYCNIVYKDSIVIADTVGINGFIKTITHKFSYNSLTNPHYLNTLGWTGQTFFKMNNNINFIRYTIEKCN